MFKKNAVLACMLLASPSISANIWTDFYDAKEPLYLPTAYDETATVISTHHAVIQGMYLNSKDINEILHLSNKVSSVVIVADTINLETPVIADITGKQIQIMARKITGSSDLNLLVSDDNNTLLKIVAKEIKDNVFVMQKYNSIEVKTDAGENFTYYNSQGIEGLYQDNNTNVEGLIASLPENKTFIFDQGFDLGASMYDQKPELSLQMLDWYAKVLGKSEPLLTKNKDFANLYHSLKSLQMFVELNQKAGDYIPKLKLDVYSDSYETILHSMAAYQSEYDKFDKQQNDLAARKNTALAMLGHLESALDSQEGIIKNQNDKIETYQEIVDDRIKAFEQQEPAVKAAKVDFDVGLAYFEITSTANVLFDCLNIITDIGTGIIAAYTGNPTAIATTASKMANTVDNTFFSAANLKNLSTNIANIQKISKSITEMLKLLKNQSYDHNLRKQMKELVLDIPSLEDSALNWTLTQQDINEKLGLAKTEKIKGASQYKYELDRLMIWGSSITSTQLAIVQMSALVVDLELEKNVIVSDMETVKNILTSIDSKETDLEKVEQYLFRAYNFFKRPLYTVQLNYNAAFKYHTFEDSSITPQLNGSYLDYSKNLVTMDTELLEVIEDFYDVAPQTFRTSFVLDNDGQIKELQKSGFFTFNIDKENHQSFADGLFDGKQRVRLEKMGIELLGEDVPDGKFIFQISHSGGFTDFYNGKDYKFHTSEAKRFYQYSKSGDTIEVEVDGELASDFDKYMFDPTAFSQWTIKLKDFEKIDLSGVEEIKIKLNGNWITTPWLI